MSAPVTVAVHLANPFPGLRPFREDEEHLFFGRESQVDTMVDKLAHSHFLTVVGTSGSGKSSLVNCGLRPALRRGLMGRAGTSWRMAQFRPGGDPVAAMAAALAVPGVLFSGDFEGISAQDIIEATLAMSKLGLTDIYRQAYPRDQPNLLVVVDQFEELFRYRKLRNESSDACEADEKSVALVNLLLEAASSRLPIYIVLTMRSDFLGDCAQFPGLPEAINGGEYLVPRLTREERKEAIAGPIAVAGGQISPVLLTRLVNDTGDNPDQLSILQHALNRTWARWQADGGQGLVALEHYVAIGTMRNALDLHAEKAFAELTTDRQRELCRKVFQSLTDKGTDARGIRRPTSLGALCAIARSDVDELTPVIDVFRKPSRSFLMPPSPEPLHPGTIIDISHESLMRIWNRLKVWVEEEAEAASSYSRLIQNMRLREKGAAGLITDPELSIMLDWRERWQPNADWCERYQRGYEAAITFLDESRAARDAAALAEEQKRHQEIRRTRQIIAVLAAAFIVAVGFAIFALFENSKANSERRAREQTEALNQAKGKLLATEEQARKQTDEFNGKLQVALDLTQKAEAAAEASNALAIQERDRANRNADLFITAIKAQAKAQLANNEQFEKAEVLQLDSEAKKPQAILDQDQKDLDAASKHAKELSLDAAVKSAQSAAIIANASLMDSNQISSSDLFDVSRGTRVTASSGAKNSQDAFSVTAASPDRATIFEDGKPVGYTHWIEWKTQKNVSLRSVGLFAAHDAIRLRRAFSTFRLYARKNATWIKIAEYSPALMYGGTCATQPCFPPNVKYAPGTFLGACLTVPSTTAQEFRAEFVQSVSALERFSGPRVIQIDGFSSTNCK